MPIRNWAVTYLKSKDSEYVNVKKLRIRIPPDLMTTCHNCDSIFSLAHTAYCTCLNEVSDAETVSPYEKPKWLN